VSVAGRDTLPSAPGRSQLCLTMGVYQGAIVG
jgi:hypothetical protein